MTFSQTYQHLMESYRESSNSNADFDANTDSDIHYALLKAGFENDGGDDYCYHAFGGDLTLTTYSHNRVIHCDIKIEFNMNMDGLDPHDSRRIKIHLSDEPITLLGQKTALEVYHHESSNKLVVHATSELNDMTVERLEEMVREHNPEEDIMTIKQNINSKIGEILSRRES